MSDPLRTWLAAPPPGFSWLDGGGWLDGCDGLVAAWPEEERVADSLEALRELSPGVWIGWLTYELGAEALLQRPVQRSVLPGLCLRRFAGALTLTGGRPSGELGDASRLRDAWNHTRDGRAAEAGGEAWPLGELEALVEPAEYRRRVGVALERIAAGDTYQVNLSQPFFAPWRGAPDLASLYLGLRRRSPAAMGGVIATDGGAIVSNSPETLVEVRGRDARSWPIKGTRPRGADEATDRALIAELQASDKDAAEHVMIVDLVRNDLGRLAVTGSVTAPRRPSLMTLPHVHHLVSEVRAQLSPEVSLLDLVHALFPGGSITGAPKRSTVEIIDGLESRPRGIYCGSLVLVEPASTTLSIAIRTALVDAEGLHLRSGGGIVIDSDPEAERLETLDKAAAFRGPG